MPEIRRHDPASVYAPSGGYTMGLELSGHDRLLFVSGQVPAKADGSVSEGFEAQCDAAWSNIVDVLAAAGLTVDNLVKVTTFLTDRSQIAANRVIRSRVLGDARPASTVMIAVTLDSDWLLEIEAIAAA